MKNMFLLGVTIFIFFLIGILCVYYFYPRKVSFELTKDIDKPNEKFDRIHYIGFNYIKDKEQLIFWLSDFYKKESCVKNSLYGYDSLFVQNLSKEFNFEKYDYIVTYHKRLKTLAYSPYLAKKEDLCGYLKEKPLIPTFETAITDKVYIYRIEKTDEYRSPCP